MTGYFIFYRAPSSVHEMADTQLPAGSVEQGAVETKVTIGVREAKGAELNQHVNGILVKEKIDRLRSIDELRAAERLSVSSWLEFA